MAEQKATLSPEALEMRRAYKRNWAKQHADELKAYKREWSRNNREKIRGYMAGYWERKAQRASENTSGTD